METIPESPGVPSRDHSDLDLLPLRHGDGCNGPLDEIHMQGDQENDTVPGIEVDSDFIMFGGNAENSGSDIASADCDYYFPQSDSSAEEHTRFPNNGGGFLSNESSNVSVGSSANSDIISDEERSLEVGGGVMSVPEYRLDVGSHFTEDRSGSDLRTQSNEWECLGARPQDRSPMQWIPEQPSGPSVAGINNQFLARHSQDRGLLGILHQGIEENVSYSYSGILPGALYMNGMMNFIESNRAEPFRIDCEVASWPVLMGGDERGNAVGGSAFTEPLYGNTGRLPSQNSVARSNGDYSGFMPEVGSSGASPYAVGNANSNLICATGDQRISNVGIRPAERLVLADGVRDICAQMEQLRETLREELEGQGRRERRETETGEREETIPVQGVFRPFEVPLPCTIQSLDSNHNCESEFWQDVATVRARIEREGEAASASVGVRARRWCTCASGEVSCCNFVFLKVIEILLITKRQFSYLK